MEASVQIILKPINLWLLFFLTESIVDFDKKTRAIIHKKPKCCFCDKQIESAFYSIYLSNSKTSRGIHFGYCCKTHEYDKNFIELAMQMITSKLLKYAEELTTFPHSKAEIKRQ